MSYPTDGIEQLDCMAIVGHTTATTAKIWVRVKTPGDYTLLVTGPTSGNALSFNAQITVSSGNTHTFKLDGLDPNTRYVYQLVFANPPELGDPIFDENLEFKTQPENPQSFSFAFNSCHDPFSSPEKPHGAWQNLEAWMARNDALLCINGGDQVYVDPDFDDKKNSLINWVKTNKLALIQRFEQNGQLDQPGMLAEFIQIYRAYYRCYWHFDLPQQVFARYPQYMIWDDHEIMDGWGSYSKRQRRKLINTNRNRTDTRHNDTIIDLMFLAAKQVYFEYQHSHNPTTNAHTNPSLYQMPLKNPDCQWDYDWQVGDCGFYALDMRGHHNYLNEGYALLGKKQMNRFGDWLASNKTAELKALFVVSPVPVVHWGWFVNRIIGGLFELAGKADDFRDEWAHLSNVEERDILLHRLAEFSQTHQCPVVILSGDVHSVSCFNITSRAHPGARLYNVTASGVSRKPNPKWRRLGIKGNGRLDKSKNYGAIRKFYSAGQHNFAGIKVDTRENSTQITVEFQIGNRLIPIALN